MNEHQKETAFLRHLMLYDPSEERRKLGESLARIQHDERCVRRVASVTTVFPILAIAGIAYGAILEDNLPHHGVALTIRILCDLGVASLICLVVFGVLLMDYRMKLNRLREECRQLVTRLMTSRLGAPHAAALPDTRPRAHDHAAALLHKPL